MELKRYVQHISGQGEKWEVKDQYEDYRDKSWRVHIPEAPGHYHYLPLNEYRICEPPEQWEDVTSKCITSDWGNSFRVYKTDWASEVCLPPGYRFRNVKVIGPTPLTDVLVVERKVS